MGEGLWPPALLKTTLARRTVTYDALCSQLVVHVKIYVHHKLNSELIILWVTHDRTNLMLLRRILALSHARAKPPAPINRPKSTRLGLSNLTHGCRRRSAPSLASCPRKGSRNTLKSSAWRACAFTKTRIGTIFFFFFFFPRAHSRHSPIKRPSRLARPRALSRAGRHHLHPVP